MIRLIKIVKEFSHEVLSFFSSNDIKTSCFGNLEISGQGYMVESYSKVDIEKFKTDINREIDYIKKIRNCNNLTILDIGANLGFYTIFYSKNSNSHQILSFEPFPETFKCLERNISSNQIRNAVAYNLGFFSSDRKMHIGKPSAIKHYRFFDKILKFTDKYQSGCASVYTNDKGVEVPFIAGDSSSIIQSLEKIDFIKIDVEGSELEVLKGIRNTIIKHKPFLKIEFNPAAMKIANISMQSFWDFLNECGYSKYLISPLSKNQWHDIDKDAPEAPKGSPDIIFRAI